MRISKAFGGGVEGMVRWDQAWLAVLGASTETEDIVVEGDFFSLEPSDSPEPLFEYMREG